MKLLYNRRALDMGAGAFYLFILVEPPPVFSRESTKGNVPILPRRGEEEGF